MKFKKQSYRSKKGMTLVELLVGIAIIVIVFSAVIWGMAHGYTTTVNNVTVDKASAASQAITDNCIGQFSTYKISCKDDFDITVGSDTTLNNITQNILMLTGAQYRDPSVFMNDTSVEKQFTIEIDVTTTVSSGTTPTEIKGCVVRSAVMSSSGFIITTAFVPYYV